VNATARTATGGAVVADALGALGADAVFGLPGIHALPVWDALRDSGIRLAPLRTELDAGFAADGYARVSGRPAPLLLSTGPGALNALTALMEAASAHVPVVAIASGVPRAFLGRHRGYLHELDDQLASFAPVVKHAVRVEEVEELPGTLARAWELALRAPRGPVFVEVPSDVLEQPAGGVDGSAARATPTAPAVPDSDALDRVAELLASAETPVLWAGGGVVRGEANAQVLALAERLDAPVVTTFMGKGAVPDSHPLAVGSACNEAAVLALLAAADVVLAVGTQLGTDTTDDHALRFAGTLVHLDADPRRVGATYDAVGLVGDAAPTLAAVLERLPGDRQERDGAARAAAVRAAVADRLVREEDGPELGMIRALRAALPTDAVDAWDSTILGYWAASYFEARLPGRFLYPLGSGTIGYGFPAALGAAAAFPGTPVLAVAGDGGIQYGLAELAAARQLGLPVKLVLVDDGGYGILREYQAQRFGRLTATDLEQPDFAAVCEGFGLPVRRSSAQTLGDDLSWALAQSGPVVMVVQTELSCYRMS
jgi:acetolactate synthase I/II/III large subunit